LTTFQQELARAPAAPPAAVRTRRRLRLGLRGARLAVVLVGVGALAVVPGIAWYVWRQRAVGDRTTKGGAVTSGMRSIAVLPFVDITEKHDQEYFSDGLSEELIDRLSHSPDLRVIARTSSFQFKGRSEDVRSIARKLDVTHLLEGSVRKAGNDLRVTAQLVRASDGAHVWSQTYDRKLSDIFEVQDEVARTVASALNAALHSRATSVAQARAPSKEAYNQVLLGTYFFNRQAPGDDERAYNSYLEATKLDADYALAWAKLSRVTYKNTPEGRAKALAAVQRAVSIDPSLAYPHYVLGRHLLYFEWDWPGAKVELERAIELDPDDLPARVEHAWLTEGMFGHFERKIAYLRQAVSNDPLDPFSLSHLAATLLLAGRFEEAAAITQRLLQLNPTWPGGNADYAKSLLLAGRPREALAAAEKEPDEDGKQYGLALVQWRLGHRLESDAALARLEKKEIDSPGLLVQEIAEVHAYRGEKVAAFELLDRAYRLKGQFFMTALVVNPMLRNLHGDARYDALLAKLKLDRALAASVP
ncbi:MAG: tetratricopeptide repeat protein, partial [Myxococcales bacterium]